MRESDMYISIRLGTGFRRSRIDDSISMILMFGQTLNVRLHDVRHCHSGRNFEFLTKMTAYNKSCSIDQVAVCTR